MEPIDLEERPQRPKRAATVEDFRWSRAQRRLLVLAALVVAASFVFSAWQDKRRTDVSVEQACRQAAFEVQGGSFGREVDPVATRREVNRRLAECGSQPLPVLPDRRNIPNDPEQ